MFDIVGGHYRSDKNCRVRTLSPLNLEKDVELECFAEALVSLTPRFSGV